MFVDVESDLSDGSEFYNTNGYLGSVNRNFFLIFMNAHYTEHSIDRGIYISERTIDAKKKNTEHTKDAEIYESNDSWGKTIKMQKTE